MAEGQTGFLRMRWKQDGLFPLAARLILGAVFIYASIDKIAHPEAFAKVVYNYQILPDILVNLTAIIPPWLELILGFFLIIGLFREGSVGIVTALLVVFLGAMIFNLVRGLDIHCGCFSTRQEAASNISMCLYVFRDGLFLLLGLCLLSSIFLGKQ